MSTANTTEHGLIRTIPPVYTAAAVTRLAGIARVNRHNHHAYKPSFVVQKHPELTERPIAVSGALLSTRSLCPFADMRQFLDRDSACGAFSFGNQLLGNRMVRLLLKAALSTAEGFQAPFRAFGANGLQGITTTLVALAHPLDLCAAVDFTVAVSRKVDDAEINAQRVINFARRWFGNIAHSKQVELPMSIDQISFAASGSQHRKLTFPGHKRHVFEATTNRPDRDTLRVHRPRQQLVIVSNAAERSKRTLGRPIQLVSISNFGDTADRHLCRQVKSVFARVVTQMMQLELSECFGSPGLFADGITRGVRLFQRAFQGIRLFRCRQELYLGDQLHIGIYVAQTEQLYKEEGGNASPLTRCEGSLPQLL